MARTSIESRTYQNKFIRQVYQKGNFYFKKALFVDRDGLLNKEVNYLSNPSQIEVLPSVIEGIKVLNGNGVAVLVVTNQPVIARGIIDLKTLKSINNYLVSLLNKKGAYVNAVYSCPHHPERNHLDIPPFAMKYRIDCDCRKPGVAMLKQAVKDYNINLKSAYMAGDRTVDVKTGKNLGIKTILVKTGFMGKDYKFSVKPDYICEDFSKAVDIIVST